MISAPSHCKTSHYRLRLEANLAGSDGPMTVRLDQRAKARSPFMDPHLVSVIQYKLESPHSY
jgi:hypothetical protein